MNYDSTVWWYDGLAGFVYAGRVLKAQRWAIKNIPPGSNVLIVGGGTGRILPDVIDQSPASICYIEKSGKMLKQAMNTCVNMDSPPITWLHGDESAIPQNAVFDAILTFHLFSNYSPAEGKILFQKLDKHLKPQGLWLYTEFVATPRQKTWQKGYSYAMIWFFRVVVGIMVREIPDMVSFFQTQGYHNIKSRSFFGGFIDSCVYRK